MTLFYVSLLCWRKVCKGIALTSYVSAGTQYACLSKDTGSSACEDVFIHTHTRRGKVLLVYFRKWLCGNIRFVPNWHTDWHHFLYPKLGSVPRSGKQQSAFFASRGVYLLWDRRLYWWMLRAGRLCLRNLLILNLNISVHATFQLCVWINRHNLIIR